MTKRLGLQRQFPSRRYLPRNNLRSSHQLSQIPANNLNNQSCFPATLCWIMIGEKSYFPINSISANTVASTPLVTAGSGVILNSGL